MEIITEDGKDYLITYIAKIDKFTVDANGLFADLKETTDKIVKAYNKKHKSSYNNITGSYGKNLQKLLDRYSGNYFSPSFMAGYQSNPALSLMQNFFTEQSNDATAIGTTFHSVLEDYYALPAEERFRDKLWELETKHIRAGQNKELLDSYISGYYDIKDYLHPKTALDDTKLICKTEHRGTANIYVKSIDYSLPCSISYVADRVDFRDDGEVVILDYKTGHPKDSAVSFDGYLGSMILYKWAMEQELNTTITKGYLVCPGNKPAKKYLPLDYSIENEKKMMEQIERFYKSFLRDTRNREYAFTNNGYFTTEDAKQYKAIMNDNTIWMSKLPLKIYIGEHDECCI